MAKKKNPAAVALGKLRQASMTPEQRSELARKAVATRIRTQEQRQADGRKGAEIANASMTAEQRSANAGKGGAAAAARSTPEQRSERARKAALARHAKKKQKPEADNG